MVDNNYNNDIKLEDSHKDFVDKRIEDLGQTELNTNNEKHKIYLLSIIGEIEGHENAADSIKTTKYEHLLPKLAHLEDDNSIDGLLILLQTTGGDCSAGLAIAEMISAISKPTVSIVCGDCHSIGVPLAVSTDYSYIVPTGTMIVHPVRMSGTIIGAPQTFEYFKIIQDRIVGFISSHSKIEASRLEKLMLNKSIMTKDLGSILVGDEAVSEGLIDAVGGINNALKKLHSLIDLQ